MQAQVDPHAVTILLLLLLGYCSVLIFKILCYYLRIERYHYFSHSSQFIIHNHHPICRYITYIGDKVSLNKQTKKQFLINDSLGT
jgi:hypothetical protein